MTGVGRGAGWAAVYISPMADSARAERIDSHERNPKWQSPPLIIDMSMCINCDTCIRHCPPQFGAIFNHGIDVIILPELCSGCGKCLPPVCPVELHLRGPGLDAVAGRLVGVPGPQGRPVPVRLPSHADAKRSEGTPSRGLLDSPAHG